MGELHLNIYVERMKREFNCPVEVGKPQVAYRETISRAVEYDYTHKKQTGGAGQFAKVAGVLEPLGENAKTPYEFVDKIVSGRIPKEYIPAVDKGFKEQMAKGPLIGFPIVGIKAVLSDGAFHDVDSSEMAFRICAMAAFREFYMKASPIALEPLMKLEVSAPEEFQGAVLGQINQRRGVIKGTETREGWTVVEAETPLAEMFEYSTDLRSATQGKGVFTMEFSKYARAPRELQEKISQSFSRKAPAKKQVLGGGPLPRAARAKPRSVSFRRRQEVMAIPAILISNIIVSVSRRACAAAHSELLVIDSPRSILCMRSQRYRLNRIRINQKPCFSFIKIRNQILIKIDIEIPPIVYGS